MSSKTEAIVLEQDHFDRAWHERERTRETLRSAGDAAGGARKTAGEVRKAAEAQMAKLGEPDEAVAFGRFDQEGESFYVGQRVISTEDQDLLVINWQAKAAEPFYKATVQEPLGVDLKRTYTCKKNKIVDFDETVLAAMAKKIEELTGAEQWGVDDAVLRDLDVSRSGEMRDIVQTIHAAQYELIQAPIDSLLVIQGGPGTGKTAVALHRISWLLYNHRDTLSPDECLVIGPNPTFTRYIKSVLPGLGDQDVVYRDLRNLGPQKGDVRTEEPEVARLKGEARMSGLLRTSLWQRVRFPERTDRLPVGAGAGAPSFSREEIESELTAQRQQSSYNVGRNGMRAYLQTESHRRAGRGIPPSATVIDNALERVWPSMTPQSFLRDLLSSRERLLAAAGEDFTAGDITRLTRSATDRLSDETWSDADVALLDELDELINGRGIVYSHIILDEAQDLSPMQLRSVRRRSRTGSMTVVGDIAQSTGAWARDSWDEIAKGLIRDAPVQHGHLTLGYRVPRQVYEFAARLLPFAAPEVEAPRVVRDGPSDPEIVSTDLDSMAHEAVNAASRHAGSGRFVGLVVDDSLRTAVIDEFDRRDIQWGDVSEGELDKAINLARPAESKGLEFDAVVVVNPQSIVESGERGYRLLYVALTRTTKYLTVLHQPEHAAMPIPTADAPASAPHVATVDEPPVSPADVVPPVIEPPEPPSPERAPSPSLSTSGHGVTSASTGGHDLGEVLAQAAASSLALQVKASVAPAQFPLLVDKLRRELGVTSDEMLEMLE